MLATNFDFKLWMTCSPVSFFREQFCFLCIENWKRFARAKTSTKVLMLDLVFFKKIKVYLWTLATGDVFLWEVANRVLLVLTWLGIMRGRILSSLLATKLKLKRKQNSVGNSSRTDPFSQFLIFQ